MTARSTSFSFAALAAVGALILLPELARQATGRREWPCARRACRHANVSRASLLRVHETLKYTRRGLVGSCARAAFDDRRNVRRREGHLTSLGGRKGSARERATLLESARQARRQRAMAAAPSKSAAALGRCLRSWFARRRAAALLRASLVEATQRSAAPDAVERRSLTRRLCLLRRLRTLPREEDEQLIEAICERLLSAAPPLGDGPSRCGLVRVRRARRDRGLSATREPAAAGAGRSARRGSGQAAPLYLRSGSRAIRERAPPRNCRTVHSARREGCIWPGQPARTFFFTRVAADKARGEGTAIAELTPSIDVIKPPR